MALKRTEIKRSKIERTRKKNQAKTARRNAKKLQQFEKMMHYESVCEKVDERDKKKCQFKYCRSTDTNHHHCLFRSQGGADDIENLVTLCTEHHTAGKESPHQSIFWRRYWEDWAAERYPSYWAYVRAGQEITQRHNNAIGV